LIAFLQPHHQAGCVKKLFDKFGLIFGGLGPNFLIWAFWVKNKLFAIFSVKMKIKKWLIAFYNQTIKLSEIKKYFLNFDYFLGVWDQICLFGHFG